MSTLDPDVASASTALIAAHKRAIKEKNRLINSLQTEKGELQRALQSKTAEVVRAWIGTQKAIDEAIHAQECMIESVHETPDTPLVSIEALDQLSLSALTALGNALDTLSRDWPGHFDIDLTVKVSGDRIAAWHQEDGVTEWQLGKASD